MSSPAADALPLDRIALVRKLAEMQATPSPDGAVNHDSIVFLAKFIAGQAGNATYVIGAIRCSGATPAQLARVIDLLAEVVPAGCDPESAVERVSRDLGILVAHHRVFPGVAVTSVPESPADENATLRDWRARGLADRARAEEDEQTDRAIADLLAVDVRKIEGEWGWEQTSNDSHFNPTADPAIAFQLMCTFRLNITFLASDVAVTFTSSQGRWGPFSVSASSYGESLPRTICIAALRKAALDSQVH